MKNWASVMIVFLLLLCIDLSCSGAQLVELPENDSANAGRKVLIATRQSEFKDQIVKRLIADYGNHANLKLIELSDISDIQPAGYDAMVVMGARMGWLMFSGRERRFLRHLQHPEKLIVLMTAARRDWEWDREDVDVITCASRQENFDPIYSEDSKRLYKQLEK